MKGEFSHRTSKDTFYYIRGPEQSYRPDGTLKKDTKVRRADEVNGPYTRVETENDVICYVQERDLAIYDTIDAYLRLFKIGGSAAVLKRVFAFFKNDEDREREVERLEAAGWSVKRNEPFEFEPPKTPHS